MKTKSLLFLIILMAGGFLFIRIVHRYVPARQTSGPSAAPILIIDAGHGGADGGAVAADGTEESGINLAIARKLEAVSGLFAVNTVMTRDSEEIDYPASAATIREKKIADQKARAALIASCPNAVLISIHQNMYSSAAVKGAQVLYAAADDSRILAEQVQGDLIALLDPDNRRSAARISEDIYLMRNVHCPAILVECGFLSNPGELELLKSEAYQQKLALIFAAGFLRMGGGAEASYDG